MSAMSDQISKIKIRERFEKKLEDQQLGKLRQDYILAKIAKILDSSYISTFSIQETFEAERRVEIRITFLTRIEENK